MNLSIFIELFSKPKSVPLIPNPGNSMLPAFHPYYGSPVDFLSPPSRKCVWRITQSRREESSQMRANAEGMASPGFLSPWYGAGNLSSHPSQGVLHQRKPERLSKAGGFVFTNTARAGSAQQRGGRQSRSQAPGLGGSARIDCMETAPPPYPVFTQCRNIEKSIRLPVAQNSRCRCNRPCAGDWFCRANPTGG